MLIAKIENGSVTQIADHAQVFPNTSFPTSGPDLAFLQSHGYLPVAPTPSFDPATQQLQSVQPVIDSSSVKMFNVVAIPAQQLQQTLISAITLQTQMRLDAFAMSRGYDNILSACTYATSAIPKFAAEGQYCVQQRDATWATLYQIMADVQNNVRPMPTGYADIEAELPALVWPA